MKAADQIKSRSTDHVQLYGAFVGGVDPGCQDYCRPITLQGVRIVDAKWLESLAAAHDDLLASLDAVLSQPFSPRADDQVLSGAMKSVNRAKGLTE